jgi:DNA-binding response OmpR family regulator
VLVESLYSIRNFNHPSQAHIIMELNARKNLTTVPRRFARRLPSFDQSLVLVIEDNDDMRFLLRTLLEMRNCRVIESNDGEAGLNLAEEVRPALIVTDDGLGQLDGITLLRRLRAQDNLRSTPIILISSYATDAHKFAALSAGCDDYLIKPLDFDHLDCVLVRHLAPQGQAA